MDVKKIDRKERYDKKIKLIKRERDKQDSWNQREWYAIRIKELELERDRKEIPEMKSFFAGAKNLLINNLDVESGYDYTGQKTRFCKKYNINF